VIQGFLFQRSPAYRNFQIVFTLLTLNFFIPSLSYLFAPGTAMAQFSHMNQVLGGPPYLQPETQSHFWRYLGIANVLTLAFACALLQWNLRRFYAALWPLTFLKSTAATLWLAGFLSNDGVPVFLGASILDYATSAAFVYFATRARREIEGVADEHLVPRPRGAQG
jgi:hypothetical protein